MRAGLMLLLILLAILNTRCAEDTEITTVTQHCSVTQDPLGNGLISCPDGSEVLVPPDVINNTIVLEIPVIIKRHKNNCKKD